MKCGRCGELTRKETFVTLDETFAIPNTNGKGTAHLVQKCKGCGRDGNVKMIPGRGRPLTLQESERGNFAPLMVFECRGYEPLDFAFHGGYWTAESVAGTLFYDIDLAGGEFSEYCEKGECPVMITKLRAKFNVVK